MHYLFNRNTAFVIAMIIIFTIVFSMLFFTFNAYALPPNPEPIPSGFDYDYYTVIGNVERGLGPETCFIYHTDPIYYDTINYDFYTHNSISGNDIYIYIYDEDLGEWDGKNMKHDLSTNINFWGSQTDVEFIETNCDIYDYNDYSNLIFSSADTYTIAPGESLNFDADYSVMEDSWDMEFDIISGTKYGSMTFYKDDNYDYADFNILMSTLGTSYDNSITVTSSDKGNYTFINNSGYTLEYTDNNPNITNINTTVGYYVADIGQTVYLDLTDLTGIDRTLSAQSNLNQSMIMYYTEIDSTGMAVSRINDSFSTLTLKPGYEYYIMWSNGEYAENSTVRFTSPVRPTYSDPIENDESYFGEYYNPVDPFKKIRIGDNENYFDIVSHSEKVGSATLDLYNAEFKVKHFKYINDSWVFQDAFTVANTSQMNLQTLGIEPDIDKLEFYLQKGTADLNILRTAEEGTDYTINYQYKYFNLYEELQDETSTEYEVVKDKLRNDLGREPTNEEIAQYINENQYEDTTSFDYAEDSETALNTIKESLSIVTTMVNIMFSNPITGIFVTAFGITIPIAIWKFVRG